MLTEPEKERLEEFIDSIHYSSRYAQNPQSNSYSNCGFLSQHFRYSDSEYEYRHVQLPKDMIKRIPKDYFDPSKGTLKLLWEEEWRGLGITQVCASFALRQVKHP